MPRIDKSPTALRDLDEIWFHIAQDHVVAADRLIDKIEEKCRQYSRQPLMGGSCPELADELRCFHVGNYVVYFFPLRDGIEVVRVVHGARNVERLF